MPANQWNLRFRREIDKPLEILIHKRLNPVPNHQGQIGIRAILFVRDENFRDRPALLGVESLESACQLQTHIRRTLRPRQVRQTGPCLPAEQAAFHKADEPPTRECIRWDLLRASNQKLVGTPSGHIECPERPQLAGHIRLPLEHCQKLAMHLGHILTI